MRYGHLPWPTPDQLDADQRRFYEAIVGGPRGTMPRATPLTDDDGRLHGPHAALLTHPRLGLVLQAVGAELRFSGVLPRYLFELLVLRVAARRHASFEWYAHAPIATKHGITDEQLEAIRGGRTPDGLSYSDRAVLELVDVSVCHERPAEELVRRVEATHGEEGVTEVIVAVGFYDLLATLLSTWAIPLPEGVADPLA